MARENGLGARLHETYFNVRSSVHDAYCAATETMTVPLIASGASIVSTIVGIQTNNIALRALGIAELIASIKLYLDHAKLPGRNFSLLYHDAVGREAVGPRVHGFGLEKYEIYGIEQTYPHGPGNDHVLVADLDGRLVYLREQDRRIVARALGDGRQARPSKTMALINDTTNTSDKEFGGDLPGGGWQLVDTMMIVNEKEISENETLRALRAVADGRTVEDSLNLIFAEVYSAVEKRGA